MKIFWSNGDLPHGSFIQEPNNFQTDTGWLVSGFHQVGPWTKFIGEFQVLIQRIWRVVSDKTSKNAMLSIRDAQNAMLNTWNPVDYFSFGDWSP